jgi:hypothetical protein
VKDPLLGPVCCAATSIHPSNELSSQHQCTIFMHENVRRVWIEGAPISTQKLMIGTGHHLRRLDG